MVMRPSKESIEKAKGTLDIFNVCEDCFYWYHPDQTECMRCEVYREKLKVEGYSEEEIMDFAF